MKLRSACVKIKILDDPFILKEAKSILNIAREEHHKLTKPI